MRSYFLARGVIGSDILHVKKSSLKQIDDSMTLQVFWIHSHTIIHKERAIHLHGFVCVGWNAFINLIKENGRYKIDHSYHTRKVLCLKHN